MNIYSNKKIITILPSLWGFLGFYRGIQDYNYKYNIKLEDYNKDNDIYNKKLEEYSKENKEDKKYLYNIHKYYKPIKPNKYYLTSMTNGLNGLIFYIAPIPGIFYFVKEIYRAEVYLRGLDDEKNKNYYNTLDL